MNLEAIRELIKLMKENYLTEVDIESEGERVRLRAEPPPAPHVVCQPVAAPQMLAPPLAAPGVGAEPPPVAQEADNRVIIKSPIVGTFYSSSAPDKPSFVQEGDRIDENSVLCIIEAMKVMNEIKAEMHGVVREILAQSGQPVEFGQPLFAIEPLA